MRFMNAEGIYTIKPIKNIDFTILTLRKRKQA